MITNNIRSNCIGIFGSEEKQRLLFKKKTIFIGVLLLGILHISMIQTHQDLLTVEKNVITTITLKRSNLRKQE